MSAPCLPVGLLKNARFIANICRMPHYNNYTHVRQYARYLRRNPVRVLTPEEADKLASGQNSASKFGREQRPHGWPQETPVADREPGREHAFHKGSPKGVNQRNEFTLPDGFTYEVLEEGDKRAGPIFMAAKSKKMREQSQIVILEGKRLINDAIHCGATIKGIYFDRVGALKGLALETTDAPLYKMRSSHLKIWSDVATSQGVLAVAKMPKQGELSFSTEENLPLTLICDNIRDPGNMATVLRTAGAVGCKHILITKGCVDIWEPKVLRAGAGIHFRRSIINNLGWEIIGNYLENQSQIYLADHRSEIPQPPTQVRREVIRHIGEAKDDKYTETDEESGQSFEVDDSYNEKTVDLYKELPLPLLVYYEADFTQGEPVLVIGGEGEGLSAAAHKLAFDRNGDKLHIPMMPGMESLNSSVAASVIMFEIKRQLARDFQED